MPNETLYYVGVKFQGTEKSYYFSTDDNTLKINDYVVVYTVNGYEVGKITTPIMSQANYHSSLPLKPIVRKASQSDMSTYEYNLEEAKKAIEIAKEKIAELGLPMDVTDAFYVLDGSRITITFTSPEKRVDFRELLRVLPPLLHCRIELRQIAARDRAKMTGGIGMCGLPLCCSTFLTEFEGISIGKAKNQMLTLNIPKLSGPCGKLICCLDYEDELYTEAKKEFPRFGTVVHLEEGDYSVDGMNILSKTVRLANAARDDYKTYSLEDVKAMMNGTYKKPSIEAEKGKSEDLFSSFRFHLESNENKENKNVQNNEQERRNGNNHYQNRHHNKHNNQNRGNNPQQPQNNEQRSNNQHHRFHRHNNNKNGNKNS